MGRSSLLKKKPDLTPIFFEDYLKNNTTQAKVREYEKQIDQLVYELYGLTTDEIKIAGNT